MIYYFSYFLLRISSNKQMLLFVEKCRKSVNGSPRWEIQMQRLVHEVSVQVFKISDN